MTTTPISLTRVDEEVRVEDAGPRAAAGRTAVRPSVSGELEAEAPPVLAGAEGEVSRQRLIGGLLRLHHHVARFGSRASSSHRLLAEDALAVQRAAIEQHAQEQAVVAGRAIQAAVALHSRGNRCRHRQLGELAIVAARVDGDDARDTSSSARDSLCRACRAATGSSTRGTHRSSVRKLLRRRGRGRGCWGRRPSCRRDRTGAGDRAPSSSSSP